MMIDVLYIRGDEGAVAEFFGEQCPFLRRREGSSRGVLGHNGWRWIPFPVGVGDVIVVRK